MSNFNPPACRDGLSRTALLAAGIVLAVSGAARADDGAALFNQNCAVCHQAGGVGAPGQFPPLKGRVDRIAASPEGRRYLAALLTHGMTGQITVAGVSYTGYMPSFAQLPDSDIATILDWVSALGGSGAPAVSVADLTAARKRALTPAGLVQEREALGKLHPLP